MTQKGKETFRLITNLVLAVIAIVAEAYALSAVFGLIAVYYIWHIFSGKASPYQHPIVAKLKERRQKKYKKSMSKILTEYNAILNDIDKEFACDELDKELESYENKR